MAGLPPKTGVHSGKESTMKIRPLGDRILVKREEAAETVSGAVLDDPPPVPRKPRRVFDA